MLDVDYSRHGDIAYIKIVEIEAGGSKKQRVMELPTGGIIVMDFSAQDELLGIEIVYASVVLPKEFLQKISEQ